MCGYKKYLSLALLAAAVPAAWLAPGVLSYVGACVYLAAVILLLTRPVWVKPLLAADVFTHTTLIVWMAWRYRAYSEPYCPFCLAAWGLSAAAWLVLVEKKLPALLVPLLGVMVWLAPIDPVEMRAYRPEPPAWYQQSGEYTGSPQVGAEEPVRTVPG